jgi:hypothetical protein
MIPVRTDSGEPAFDAAPFPHPVSKKLSAGRVLVTKFLPGSENDEPVRQLVEDGTPLRWRDRSGRGKYRCLMMRRPGCGGGDRSVRAGPENGGSRRTKDLGGVIHGITYPLGRSFTGWMRISQMTGGNELERRRLII